MTDHKITDLSYGQLGEASYNIDEDLWSFSVDTSTDHIFQQLLPFRQHQQPSIPNNTKAKRTTANTYRSHLKWLVTKNPETFPANASASSLARAVTIEPCPALGQLLAIGGAVDADHLPGLRTKAIIAMPCGEAGHVLRLIMPRIERQQWRNHSSVKLSVMNSVSSINGYWLGNGGIIQQVTFADEGNTSCTWLAVRQSSVITIFKPMYDSRSAPATVPLGYGTRYPSSRLRANPVTSLTVERTGSRKHVDVSFNPFYTRQFAIVDEVGSWSIWDIEGRLRKRSTLTLLPGKSGKIYDDYLRPPNLKEPDFADGWHRIMWVNSVSTIVVCNRRHLAIFDVKSTPTRLHADELLAASNTDWILDIKRSVLDSNRLIILTTSRIFWIDVTASGEDHDDISSSGARVLLSYRHFRDANDGSLKLTVLGDENVSVLISSEKSFLVDYYSFCSDGISGPRSVHGSFILATKQDDGSSPNDLLQTLYALSTPLIATSSSGPGQEAQYTGYGVKFYQIWTLMSDLSLNSTLYTVYSKTTENCIPSGFRIVAPRLKATVARRGLGPRYAVDDTFIVRDEDDDENLDFIPSRSVQLRQKSMNSQDDVRFRLNWTSVFRSVFVEKAFSTTQEASSMEPLGKITEVLDKIMDHINNGKNEGELPMSSFLEICQVSGFSDDLEIAAPILQEFLDSLYINIDDDAASTLVISDLTSCPGIKLPAPRENQVTELLAVYDYVGDHWIASLPERVSNLARLSKFKIARKAAVDLCLSSIAVSLREKRSQIAEHPASKSAKISLPLLNNFNEFSREESPPYLSSQITSSAFRESQFGLPTPARTPSLYSHASASATSIETIEDAAVSRLRQYAVSMKLPAKLGRSTILAEWPSFPGHDPLTYKWEAAHKAAALHEDEDEDDRRARREEARRRKRMERFLNREKDSISEIASQPAFLPFGSQPEAAQYAASSQTVDDIPMTQPDRGAFGSRVLSKNKPKKRRAAGF